MLKSLKNSFKYDFKILLLETIKFRNEYYI